jgi:hypothetical protein
MTIFKSSIAWGLSGYNEFFIAPPEVLRDFDHPVQGSVLGPLLFLAYVNDIWRNIESKIRLFADD